jgi:hypothetical protein
MISDGFGVLIKIKTGGGERAANDHEEDHGAGGVAAVAFDVETSTHLAVPCRRSFGCRARWAWALARLSASTRKLDLVGKLAGYGILTGPTLMLCCKLSESSKTASSLSS